MNIKNNDYEETYESFWKEIIEENGKVNMDNVKKELHDYRFLLIEIPKVYQHITNGKLSKTNYFSNTIINEYEDCKNDEFRESIEDLVECHGVNGVVSVEDIEEYFGI